MQKRGMRPPSMLLLCAAVHGLHLQPLPLRPTAPVAAVARASRPYLVAPSIPAMPEKKPPPLLAMVRQANGVQLLLSLLPAVLLGCGPLLARGAIASYHAYEASGRRSMKSMASG